MASPSVLNKTNIILNFFLAIVRNRVPNLRSLDKAELLSVLNLQTPDTRRKVSDLRFLYLVANGLIRCPELVTELCFHVPSRSTRHPMFFIPPIPRLCKIQRSLFHRVQVQYNNISTEMDLFVTRSAFNRSINLNLC